MVGDTAKIRAAPRLEADIGEGGEMAPGQHARHTADAVADLRRPFTPVGS